MLLAIFWTVTNRIEPSLLATFGGMAGVGQTIEVLAAMKTAPQPEAPPLPPGVTPITGSTSGDGA